MATTIKYKLRSDVAANWENKNPILTQGEPGFDMTANKLKIGNGSNWNSTPYLDPQVVNDLTTGGEKAALSAAQGVVLKNLVDSKSDNTTIQNLQTALSNKADASSVSTLSSKITTLETTVSGYISEAPNDGKQYGRKNGAWVELS